MRKLIVFLLLLSGAMAAQSAAFGQPFSYVYIQGDKQTPFYVKLEGEMQPRYGKNYSIISGLAPGAIHLEILFQQNVFPPQHFTVQVPENGSRGFLITKQQDSFVLYDLQQQFYLPNNNTVEEDHVPTQIAAQPVKQVEVPEEKPVVAVVETPKPKVETTKPKKKPVSKPVAKTKPNTKEGEQFIEGITLNNQHDDVVTKPTSTSTTNTDTSTTPAANDNVVQSIPNSDCPTPLSRDDFGAIYKNALNQADDEARTAFLLGKMDVCYASWQARALATMLTTDAARFTLLKKIYPRISDQSAFPLLDDLLRDPAYKDSFNQMLHPKL